MNRAEVKRLAKAKYGAKVIVEERKDVIDPETREIIREEYLRLKEQGEPKPPPEAVKWLAECREYRAKCARLRDRGIFSLKRYRIAEPYALGQHVLGHGDTWEEAARDAKLLGDT